MYCEKCGSEIKEGSKFCINCGVQVDQERPSTHVGEHNIEKYSPTSELIDLFKLRKSLRKLYGGRINRKNWITGVLLSAVALILVMGAIGFITTLISSDYSDSLLAGIVEIIIGIAAIYIYAIYVIFIFSLHTRRFHDLGQNGWLSVLLFIPIINFLTFLYLCFAKGQESSNKYGKNPGDEGIGALAIIAIIVIAIAIIGILAALVLVALGNARDKANDARIRSDINQLRTLAEVFYEASGSTYYGYSKCVKSPSLSSCRDTFMVSSISALTNDIEQAGGALTINTDISQFCISSNLRSDASQHFCVDTTGQTKEGSIYECGYFTSCP